MTDSYYGQPIIKSPVWTWEVPVYFALGGVAGVSSLLAAGARISGDRELADKAAALAAGSAVLSPVLLISDLGRPERFLHMLRVFRSTSPMSVGSWLLVAYAPAAVGAWWLGRVGGMVPLRRLMEGAAALLAPGLATYTAVLLSDTAVPVWHEARRELPLVFVGSALSAAGSSLLLAMPEGSATARIAATAGMATELATSRRMESRLGELAEPYHQGTVGRLSRAARRAGGAGLALSLLPGQRRTPRWAGAALMLAGSLLERWAIFQAGFQSAQDPTYTVKSQRGFYDQNGASNAPF